MTPDFFVKSSSYFGAAISLLAYIAALMIQRRLNHAAFNPLLMSVVFVIVFLCALKIEYGDYYNSAKYISYLLTPSTVCLAVPLYEKFSLLKKNWKAVTAAILAGTLTSLTCVFVLAKLLGLNHARYVTLLPKSVTTAVGIGVSDELGGITTITVAVIIVTGITGNLLSGILFRIFKITEPSAKGLALGTSAHAVGTVKAFELGETEGAMSSLSVAAAGIATVALAPLFARLI